MNDILENDLPEACLGCFPTLQTLSKSIQLTSRFLYSIEKINFDVTCASQKLQEQINYHWMSGADTTASGNGET